MAKKAKGKKPKQISIKEYEQFVVSMMSEMSMKDFEAKLTTAGLGLAGESGEIADIAKKVLFHGMEFTPEVKQKLAKEAGDAAFYFVFLCCVVLEMSVKEVLQMNKDKLMDRFKSGTFSVAEFMEKERAKE